MSLETSCDQAVSPSHDRTAPPEDDAFAEVVQFSSLYSSLHAIGFMGELSVNLESPADVRAEY